MLISFTCYGQKIRFKRGVVYVDRKPCFNYVIYNRLEILQTNKEVVIMIKRMPTFDVVNIKGFEFSNKDKHFTIKTILRSFKKDLQGCNIPTKDLAYYKVFYNDYSKERFLNGADNSQ